MKVKKYKIVDSSGKFYKLDSSGELKMSKNRDSATVFLDEEAKKVMEDCDKKLFRIMVGEAEIKKKDLNKDKQKKSNKSKKEQSKKNKKMKCIKENNCDKSEEEVKKLSKNVSKDGENSSDEYKKTIEYKIFKSFGGENSLSYTKREIMPDEISIDVSGNIDEWRKTVDSMYNASIDIVKYKKNLEDKISSENKKIETILAYIEKNDLDSIDLSSTMNMLKHYSHIKSVAKGELDVLNIITSTFLDSSFSKKLLDAKESLENLYQSVKSREDIDLKEIDDENILESTPKEK